MQSPAFEQTDYRGRNDDGGESGATWKAATNTSYEVNPAKSTNHRVRFAVAEVNGAKDNNRQFQLQYSKNGGAWTNVGTSTSNVQAASSSNVSDGTQTTQQITTNTFAGGELAVGDALAGDNTAIDFAGGDTAEVEYSIEIIDADVAQADVIDLRVIFGDGTTLSTYTNVASITVNYNETVYPAVASVAASAVSPSVANTTVIGGTCTLNGSAVSGAVVHVVDTSDQTVVAEVTSDSNGNWSARVDKGDTYHAAARYDDGTDKYNEHSMPFLVN